MYKCWNCGTEHEDTASNDAYNRGYRDGYEFAKHTLLTPMQAEQFDEMMVALDNEHVDWCRDLYCGGCMEIKENDEN